jgi:hypothetical protein
MMVLSSAMQKTERHKAMLISASCMALGYSVSSSSSSSSSSPCFLAAAPSTFWSFSTAVTSPSCDWERDSGAVLVAVGCIFSSANDAAAGLAASVVSSPLKDVAGGGAAFLSPLPKRLLNAMIDFDVSNDLAAEEVAFAEIQGRSYSFRTKEVVFAEECSKVELEGLNCALVWPAWTESLYTMEEQDSYTDLESDTGRNVLMSRRSHATGINAALPRLGAGV